MSYSALKFISIRGFGQPYTCVSFFLDMHCQACVDNGALSAASVSLKLVLASS